MSSAPASGLGRLQGDPPEAATDWASYVGNGGPENAVALDCCDGSPDHIEDAECFASRPTEVRWWAKRQNNPDLCLQAPLTHSLFKDLGSRMPGFSGLGPGHVAARGVLQPSENLQVHQLTPH